MSFKVDLSNAPPNTMSRRRFLMWSALGSGALALAACAGAPAAAPAGAPAEPTDPPAEEPAAEAAPAEEAAAEADGEVEVMVSDVLEYTFDGDWAGGFGSVTFQLHPAMYNGEPVYHIRTDASNEAFAQEIGLVYVPLLNAAAALADGEANTYYNLGAELPAVVAKIPGDENFSSLCKYMDVTVTDSSADLSSAEAVQAAIDSGAASLEDPNIFVNYPFIMWPGGAMSVDTELVGTLDNGQLFAEPDTDAMQVTMKLHQCFPGSRYIVTDAGMMADMMSLSDAAVTNKLQELGGTDEIWVFGNGIPGPGSMGFQPAIFDNKAGQPAWSPFWDHRTLVWKDESAARVLTSSDEVRQAIADGEIDEFMGVPESHPTGFVVNCPAPILAPNNFAA